MLLHLQDKGYPRDFLRQKDNGFLLMRGRARVKLFNDAGAPLNPEIPNRGCCWSLWSCSRMTCSGMHASITTLVLYREGSLREGGRAVPTAPRKVQKSAGSSTGGGSEAAGPGVWQLCSPIIWQADRQGKEGT